MTPSERAGVAASNKTIEAARPVSNFMISLSIEFARIYEATPGRVSAFVAVGTRAVT